MLLHGRRIHHIDRMQEDDFIDNGYPIDIEENIKRCFEPDSDDSDEDEVDSSGDEVDSSGDEVDSTFWDHAFVTQDKRNAYSLFIEHRLMLHFMR